MFKFMLFFYLSLAQTEKQRSFFFVKVVDKFLNASVRSLVPVQMTA